MGDLSKNFSRHEFRCKCGTCDPIDPPQALIEVLQFIRDEFDQPVRIHSGHRCWDYNKRVGGVTNSQHLRAYAADLTIDGFPPNDVQDFVAEEIPTIGGLGRYSTFTHIDVRENGPARWTA